MLTSFRNRLIGAQALIAVTIVLGSVTAIGALRFNAEQSADQGQLATRAEWALGLTSGLAVVLSIGLSIAVVRELARQSQRSGAAAELAKRAAASRQELLAASRDLRMPLDAIVASANALERRTTRDTVELRHLETIVTAAKRVDRLLEDLFEVTRIQSGTMSLRCESCRAAGLVDLAIQRFRSRATEGSIRLRSETRTSTSVYADPERIEHVLATLIGTALEPARPGGEILVSAVLADSVVRFAVVDASSEAVPELSASGDEPSKPPTDLGLYICRRLVEAHGGDLGVDVVAGRGNTYWFTLPTEPRLLR